jgi:pimeloyl-ACP methyl ester carboxylesterase
MTDEGTIPTVVLVHGAWHEPWHWHEIGSRLARRGIRVDAVDLPSHRPGHGDLHDDATAIRSVLDRHQDAVVVAHSYGGIPATEGATGHPAVRRLVYLSAYMADENEHLGGFEPSGAEPNIHPSADLDMVDGETLVVRPDRARDVFYHDCADPESAIEHLRGMSAVVLAQTPRSVAWRDIPSTYVVTTDDRATAVGVQRELSKRAGEVFEID